MNARLGIITQARMTSTRLPGKVLKTIRGKTVLDYHLDRARRSGLPVIVATTTRETDDVIAAFCRERGVPHFRGSETDVLSRYAEAARAFELTDVVRVTSDCPLIDGEMLAQAAAQYRALKTPTYFSNCLQRCFPRGLDFEFFPRAALDEAHARATEPQDREHVTPYLRRGLVAGLAMKSFVRAADASDLRITLDTPEDFALLEKLIENHAADALDGESIIRVLRAHPELTALNANIQTLNV